MNGPGRDRAGGSHGGGGEPAELRAPSGRAEPGELPVDRRVTPEALAGYAAAQKPSRFPLGPVALGALVSWLALPGWTFVVVFALSGAPTPTIDGSELETWGIFVVAVLIFAALPAGFVGIPLGALLVRLLRGVRHRLWHFVAFLAAGGLVGLLVVAVLGEWQLAVMIPAAALAAATGWCAVHKRLILAQAA